MQPPNIAILLHSPFLMAVDNGGTIAFTFCIRMDSLALVSGLRTVLLGELVALLLVGENWSSLCLLPLVPLLLLLEPA